MRIPELVELATNNFRQDPLHSEKCTLIFNHANNEITYRFDNMSVKDILTKFYSQTTSTPLIDGFTTIDKSGPGYVKIYMRF